VHRAPCTLFLLFLLFFACKEDTVDYGLGAYYQDIVTSLGDYTYLSDAGEKIYDATPENHKSYNDSARVFLTYSFTENQTPSPDQGQAITVHGSSSVTQGNLKSGGKQDIDKLPDEPVRLESVWIGSHYLNLRFYMEHKSKTHSIGLIADKDDLNKENIHIYFKHNHNEDPPGYWVYVVTSFDLETVLGHPEGNKTLYIHLNSTNYGDKIYELRY
jgi:hypothetical protein